MADIPAQLRTLAETLPWSVLEQAPLGVALVDLEGRVQKANSAMARIVGRPVAKIERAELAELIDLGAEGPRAWIDSLRSERTLSMEQCWLRRRGDAVWGTAMAWLVRDSGGAPAYVVLLVVDVTRPRLAEQSRLWHMAAILAHEIKNSVGGIGGALQLIAKSLPGGGEERGVLEECVQRLLALDAVIDSLLDFARPVSVTPQAVPIGDVLAAAERFVRQTPGVASVRIRCSGPSPMVHGDPAQLGRVFRNLLLNAGQAMHGGGVIRVRVAERANRCVVVVTDSGPGIPRELRDMVFEPFFTTRGSAMGLGLPIARRIVEAHGGEIRVGSRGGGARVVVYLPLARHTGAAGQLAG
jgi:PAS domain S-box-containing protein